MNRAPRSLEWALLNLIDRCNCLKSFNQIHSQLVTSGIIQDGNVLVLGKSIAFFASYADFEYACEFLNQIHYHRSSFAFNSLVSAYAVSNKPQAAILVYRKIVRNGFLPDMYTFPVVLKSCSKVLGIVEGKQVHGVVAKMGFLSDLYVQNSLLHFYGLCGEYHCASKLFDGMPVRDVVSWTALISGYVRTGLCGDALALFSRMDVKPNMATLVSVFVACGQLGDLGMGMAIHGLIVRGEFEMPLVVGNALLDMYAKCGRLGDAKKVFEEIPERDIFSWTSLISGLVQWQCPKEALEVFRAMQMSGVEPDKVTISSVLTACAGLGALDFGKWVHEYNERKGIECDTHVGTAMIDMYAKCGCMDMALHIFHKMQHRNVSTWNALLGGLAMHGHGKEVLKYFEQMVRIKVRPNEVTFLAILTACCHSGLVDEGRKFFYQMIGGDYNIAPRIEHYGCMVDLLGRAGLLNEAQELIRTMPMPPDVLIWGALLSGCKAHGEIELSQKILNNLLDLESKDSGVYVLLSNIYATNDRWKHVTGIRKLMEEKGIRKAPGSSIIEVDGKSHEFLVGDSDHPQKEAIHLVLNMLAKHILKDRLWSSNSDVLQQDYFV
ncbi:PREDICTED: pentatricopeptide repeat-containing protein At4g38010 [Nelumbo nucifera]|uniref:Pentatricopeptide repeat-containing protein At4g38010 n=2 Tax=Nelumbo nucifera TaxID=4432 RepID=A0A1U8AYD8_NELNU|nr:PREDICTED: pentatricopeptide repeat-containing protein At4g38010 [Nelumbo nucifera]DAD28806.1 TPA_asm: hypothetical protein HUJ06_030274 [Nelumbo nucifera]